MPVHEYGGFRFHTKGDLKTPGTRTLIVSSHGVQTGSTFSKAYSTVLQFASPKGSLLVADLGETLKGNVTTCELAKASGDPDDYKPSYYERDPTDVTIDSLLNDKSDVLTFSKSYTDSTRVTLSMVLTCLKQWGFLYPGLLCLFCRGQVRSERPVLKDGKAYAPSYKGGKSDSAALANQHQINATAVMLELRAKKIAQ
jgi:hypothetical protein